MCQTFATQMFVVCKPPHAKLILTAAALLLFFAAGQTQTNSQNRPIDRQLAEGLIQSDVLSAIDAIQFGAGKRLDKEGLARVTKGMIVEFESNPEIFKTALAQTKLAMDETRKLKDDVEIGLSRSVLLSELYKVHIAEDMEAGSVISELFLQNPVLAFDEETEMVLTSEDAKAMTAYFAFLIDIVFEGTDVKGEEILSDLTETFTEIWKYMEIDQQLEVSASPIRWHIFRSRWNDIPSPDQAAYKSAIRKALLPDEVTTLDIHSTEGQEKILGALVGGGKLVALDPYDIIDRNNVTFWDNFARPVVGWEY